jgi:NAD(P)-dependent dehydrogenase (short-subunit alcohol dehydrogenase family)
VLCEIDFGRRLTRRRIEWYNAIEKSSQGIRFNAVAPGVIETPMHAPETHAFLAGLHPVGRMGTVQEVVDAVLYLELAGFVTGETLHVDGGEHAGHW